MLKVNKVFETYNKSFCYENWLDWYIILYIKRHVVGNRVGVFNHHAPQIFSKRYLA